MSKIGKFKLDIKNIKLFIQMTAMYFSTNYLRLKIW